MRNPTVSIVMPVFNSELYLDQCLDSLADQIFEDYEVICVDDCSTDGSLDILRDRGSRDERIVIVQRDAQGGGGAARNTGMERVQGKYTIFLDSDDFFSPELLAKCVDKAEQENADIVLFDADKYDSITRKVVAEGGYLRVGEIPNNGSGVFSKHDIPDGIAHITSPAPWLRFYRTEFIKTNTLRYQEIANTNDFSFGFLALVCAERITWMPDRLVYYRVNNQRSTQGRKNARIDCVVNAIEHLHGELVERGLLAEIEKSFLSSSLSTLVFTLRTSSNAGRERMLELVSSASFQSLHIFDRSREDYTDKLFYEYALLMLAAIDEFGHANETDSAHEDAVVVEPSLQGELLVSVVVPAFDAAPYIDQTMESLVGQSLREIEIICVDDGSTDGTLDALKAWAKRDSRITVFHQANKGLSGARNSGMHLAKGRYIYFMDSDDILESDALEQLYSRASADDLDALYFDAVPFFDDDSLKDEFPALAESYKRFQEYPGVYRGEDLMVEMRQNGEYLASACLQFCKLDFLRHADIEFFEGILHEDNLFTFEVLTAAERTGHVGRAFFHRRIRNGSIMTRPASFASAYGYFVCHEKMRERMESLHDADNPPAEALVGLVYQALENSRLQFKNMPPGEEGRAYGLGIRFQPFKSLVLAYHDQQKEINRLERLLNGMRRLRDEKAKECLRLKKRNKKLERKNEKLKENIEALKTGRRHVRSSRFHRLGRTLAKPLKKVKRRVDRR